MKKKLIALCICLAMLAIALIGGTMAYFTDEKAQENVFTTGSVGITLHEAAVKEDANGDYVKDGETRVTADEHNYGKIYPAQTIVKDPTITVASPSEATYVAAKVIVKNSTEANDLYELDDLKMDGAPSPLLNINTIIKGGLLDRTAAYIGSYNGLTPAFGYTPSGADEVPAYTVYQEKEDAHTYVFYIFIEDAMTEDESVTLFEKMEIPADWDNAEMAYLKDLSIKVEAYAVQQHGFDSCFEAITAAFGQENDDPFKF